ncbi:MAG TPA: chloride channel protein [Patescibacteria group bacterium]|nr:chloride channel protein [Patescibacteria group bacterium]
MSSISVIYNRTGHRKPFTVFMRESRPAQIILCALIGAIVGIITGVIHALVAFLHCAVFMLPFEEHLSGAVQIDARLLFTVPIAGGLLLGLFYTVVRKLRPGEIVDPIEANAIHGGRMSVIDSLRVLVSTIISNGSGISVGMEAAYTQMGACFLSWIGQRLQLRREDMRIFVAAGAAAAIAAAYNAPLAGAFYGFELVLGTYTIAALPQVTLCALTAALVLRLFTAGNPIFTLPMAALDVPARDYFAFVLVGVASSLVGIATMKAVTGCEQLFRRMKMVPEWMRPAIGGLLVGALAWCLSPQVLGSGQGGIDLHLHNGFPLLFLVLLLAGKILASALSIGSGFRGGLFSTSLFLGCLVGQIAGILASHFMPVSDTGVETFMLAGTGSVAAAIIGAPMTMIILVLEMTGSFPAMTAVLAGVLVASTGTRYWFGYSFSTWRFHLKGIHIRGPRDVGWVRELTVDKLMATAPVIVMADTPLEAVRRENPAANRRSVFVSDDKGNYQGVVSMADLHAGPADAMPQPAVAGDLAKGKNWFLLPHQDIQQARQIFADSRLEELPVLESALSQKIVGYIQEPQLLKRYAQELEHRQMAQS